MKRNAGEPSIGRGRELSHRASNPVKCFVIRGIEANVQDEYQAREGYLLSPTSRATRNF